MLKQHDWYYMMSEDANTYKRGCYAKDKLIELAKTSTNHKELFDIHNKRYIDKLSGVTTHTW